MLSDVSQWNAWSLQEGSELSGVCVLPGTKTCCWLQQGQKASPRQSPQQQGRMQARAPAAHPSPSGSSVGSRRDPVVCLIPIGCQLPDTTQVCKNSQLCLQWVANHNCQELERGHSGSWLGIRFVVCFYSKLIAQIKPTVK